MNGKLRDATRNVASAALDATWMLTSLRYAHSMRLRMLDRTEVANALRARHRGA